MPANPFFLYYILGKYGIYVGIINNVRKKNNNRGKTKRYREKVNSREILIFLVVEIEWLKCVSNIL